MSPLFSWVVFDKSPGKQTKTEDFINLDLPIMHFAQKITQNKKSSHHITYYATQKSLKALPLTYILEAQASKKIDLRGIITF